MNACYSINRKAGYVTIYNIGRKFPLEMWNEWKEAHDCTHQEVADAMVKMITGKYSEDRS